MPDINVKVGYQNTKVRVGQQNAIKVPSSIAGGADQTNRAINVIGGIASVTSLSVSGITTLSGQVNFPQTSLNVSGLSTFANNLDVGGNLKVEGTSEFVGDVTFRGGTGGTINLGDSNLDNINVGGEFASSLIPDVDNTYDIGSISKRWRDASFSDLVKSGRLEITGTSLFSGSATFSDNVTINGTDSLKIPVGTTAQRNSSPTVGQIRYNSEEVSFEGYGPSNVWVNLSGIKDIDGDTYILPESSSGVDEDILYFVTEGSTKLTISNNSSTFSNNVIINGDLTATGDIIFSDAIVTYQSLNLTNDLDVDGTTNLDVVNISEGLVALGGATVNTIKVTTLTNDRIPIIGSDGLLEDSSNLTFDGSSLSIGVNLSVTNNLNINGNSNFVGISTFSDKVIFDSTNSIQIPVGTEAQRDSVGTAVTGQIRYNTTNSTFEGFGSGGQWGSLGGVKDVDGDTYIKAESSPGSDEDSLLFFTSGSQNLILDSSGRLGIGTDPSIYHRLDVFGNARVAGFVTVTQGIYYDTGNFDGPNGISYFNNNGQLISAASTNTTVLSTSNYILTVDSLGVPVWTSTIDGGEY